ncbi:MAG: hypothetical protein J6T60_16580 [Bacteroidales bacterium]|nr:hypothetical protein [Bacteroidales bacterium]
MKRLKFLVGAVALFALVVANVWNAATTFSGSELGIADVEATVAEAEPGGGMLTGTRWQYNGGESAPFEETVSVVGYRKYVTKYYCRRYKCIPATYGSANCKVPQEADGLSVWSYLWENGNLITTSVYMYDPDCERMW